jgi:hypothetical protein
MAAIMSGFKEGGQVIIPVPLEFTAHDTMKHRRVPAIIDEL